MLICPAQHETKHPLLVMQFIPFKPRCRITFSDKAVWQALSCPPRSRLMFQHSHISQISLSVCQFGFHCRRIHGKLLVNYSKSLTWIKAFLGMIPFNHHDSSEVAVRSKPRTMEEETIFGGHLGNLIWCDVSLEWHILAIQWLQCQHHKVL